MRGTAALVRPLAASGAVALLGACLLLQSCDLEAGRGLAAPPSEPEEVPWWAASAPARAAASRAEPAEPGPPGRAPRGLRDEREALLRLERARRALAEGGHLLGEVRREAGAAQELYRERLARQAGAGGGTPAERCRALQASRDCTFLARDVVDRLGGRALGTSPDCGVVSNPRAMERRRLGQAVDSHATVVRVNAVPTAALQRDLGKRTDVFFISSERNAKPTYRTKEFKGDGWAFHGLAEVMIQGATLAAWCNTSSRAGCPFGALLFKDLDRIFHAYWYHAVLPVGSIAPSTMQVARQLYALKFNVSQAEDLAWMRLSNGFVATLTLAAICHNLTAYGMGSLVANQGSQGREASLLRELFDGEAPAVYSGLPAFSARYQRCLTAKAKAGCLHMVL